MKNNASNFKNRLKSFDSGFTEEKYLKIKEVASKIQQIPRALDLKELEIA